MTAAERLDLVTRHTAEVVTTEELETRLEADEAPSAYIGYAPTGEMHIGHFTTMRKLADFLQAGLDVTVLIRTSTPTSTTRRAPSTCWTPAPSTTKWPSGR